MPENIKDKIHAGKILKSHGICGMMKARIFLETPPDEYLGNYILDNNKTVPIKKLIHHGNDIYIISVDSVIDKNQTENYLGKDIFIERKNLKPLKSDDEYYYHDLKKMTVYDFENNFIGKVSNINNYGATDIIEINDKFLIPVNKSFLKVDIKNNKITLKESAKQFLEI